MNRPSGEKESLSASSASLQIEVKIQSDTDMASPSHIYIYAGGYSQGSEIQFNILDESYYVNFLFFSIIHEVKFESLVQSVKYVSVFIWDALLSENNRFPLRLTPDKSWIVLVQLY